MTQTTINLSLPRDLARVHRSPITIQGSKAKLLRWMFRNLRWDGEGTYYEPFLGSGVVAFNLRPRKCVAVDNNPHLIQLFQDIQTGRLHLDNLRERLWWAKRELARHGEEFYYDLRAQFNAGSQSSTTFLILNLACYRNLMRFNAQGEFNAPYSNDDTRYLLNQNDAAGHYINTIVGRVRALQAMFAKCQFEFRCEDFTKVLGEIRKQDLAIFDPPYLGRDVSYYAGFTEAQFRQLISWCNDHPDLTWAVCNWCSDATHVNPYLEEFKRVQIRTRPHRYDISSGKVGEGIMPVEECLIISEPATAPQQIQRGLF